MAKRGLFSKMIFGLLAAIVVGLFPLILDPMVAHAGPPFVRDDPDPVEYRHWEIYVASQDAKDKDGFRYGPPLRGQLWRFAQHTTAYDCSSCLRKAESNVITLWIRGFRTWSKVSLHPGERLAADGGSLSDCRSADRQKLEGVRGGMFGHSFRSGSKRAGVPGPPMAAVAIGLIRAPETKTIGLLGGECSASSPKA